MGGVVSALEGWLAILRGRLPAPAAVDPSARLAIRHRTLVPRRVAAYTGCMTNTLAPKSFTAAMGASWRSWMDAESLPPSLGWQLFWSIVWAGGFALVFTLIGFIASARTIADWLDPHTWALWFGRNYLVAALITFTIQGLFKATFALFGTAFLRRLAGWQRTLFFSGIPLLGTAIGWPIGMAILFGRMRLMWSMTSGTIVSLVVLSLMMILLFHLYFSLRHRATRDRMRANEAQLRLLQGQMEPHFLFNTLANVISLVESDPPRARHTLEALTDYLRASLGALRHDDSTLAVELDLARRYLELMRTRMGERLRFEIDADDALGRASLMPLVLQPLIENAVKHGLEPQVDGGVVRVKATRVTVGGQELLRVCVDDDGAGLAAAARRMRRAVAGGPDGNGIALANLRERLQARFGAAAQLTLAELQPGSGTRACLVIPWQAAAAA
jgi:signal transduction histidine kinase